MKLDQELVITCCASAHAGAVSELLQGALAALQAEGSSGTALEAAAVYSKERIIRDMTSRLSYVAVSRHQIIGVIILSPNGHGDTVIEALCVAPEHQGQGIGELLMETAERRAGELGIKRLGVAELLRDNGYLQKRGYQVASQELLLEKALA